MKCPYCKKEVAANKVCPNCKAALPKPKITEIKEEK